jgi:Flp pilus assembly protein TadD
VSAARAAVPGDPATALREADRALRIDPELIGAYYAKAAALARFDESDASKAALREAARREPRNFVTWALLGDLAVRTGNFGEARRFYRRALALNPRDPSLVVLARDPRSALP